MEGSMETVAIDTLDLLESRLRRIEYVVTGNADRPAPEADHGNAGSIATRLADLEHAFKQLSMESEIVQEVLQLHAQFPDAFASASSGQESTSMSVPDMLSIVLSSATQYSKASSDLTIIHDMPIPSAETSASLVELQPRVANLGAVQQRQAREIAALRQRSAKLLERWYDVAILGEGDCWTGWDKRMLKVERDVKRAEVTKIREEEEL